MDRWTDAQFKKMQTGGNAKCLAFFKQSSEYTEGMPIAQKYNAPFAAAYREKVSGAFEV